MPPRWPRGRTSRRAARSEAVTSRITSQVKSTRTRVTLNPLARKARYPGFGPFSASVRLTVRMVSSASPDSRLPRLAPPPASSPIPGVPALDLRAVRRRRAHHQAAVLLLDPAEGRDVLVGAHEDPGLAGTGLGGEVGLPLGQAVALVGDPARHRGRAPVAHRVAEHRQREAVDLQEHDAGHVGTGAAALASGDAARDPERVRVVVVGPEDHLQDDAHRRHDQRGEQRVAEAVHADVIRQGVGRDLEQERVGQQHEHEAQEQGEREPQRRDDRRHQRIEDRHEGRRDERSARVLELDARQDGRGDPQRRRRDSPADDQSQRADPGRGGLPADRLAVGGRRHPR